jgi:ABC-type transport system substrate-binding protein
MLDKGEANMLLGLYPEELSRYENRPEFTTYRVRANHSTLELNWLEAPFDDQKVRQAVSHATPYAQIIEQVYNGYAKMNKSPIANVSKFYTEEYWHYDTDVEKARRLMKESGHPDGFDTELYILPSNESLRFGEIMKAALKPIGINVEVRLVGRTKFGQKVPMWFKEECGHALYEPMYDLGHDYDPPLGMWGGRNIRDKMWTERLREIRQAEASQQEQLYKNIQRDIVDFAPAVHIAEIQTGWAFRGEIDPWVVGPYCLTTNTTVWSAHRQIMPYW